MKITIRPVVKDDCNLLWSWTNDDEVRAASFSTHFITPEEHKKWFESRLDDPDTSIFIVNNENVPVGVVRFERALGEAKISVTIDKTFRNSGYGSSAIRMASDMHRRKYKEKIVAYIKGENVRSINAFTKAGYILKDTTTINGIPAVVMTSG